MKANPSEPTGRQQPEGERLIYPGGAEMFAEQKTIERQLEMIRARNLEIEQKDKRITELESHSRWREISVDGLPGEEYAGKYIIFAFSASAMVYKWEVLKFHKKSITDTFTHWREIELPS